MQGIGYTLKVWLSGLLLTPFAYLLFLAVIPGYHIPELIGFLFIVYVIPYTCIVSVWIGLGLFCAISLLRYYDLSKNRVKLFLSIVSIAIVFLGFTMLQHIPAMMMYRDDYSLPTAYTLTSVLFIWICQPNIDNTKKGDALTTIKSCFIYSLIVWFVSYLLSVPFTLVALFYTKGFSPGSLRNATKAIIEHYQIQLNISIAFLITLLLISLVASNLNLSQHKKKMWIILFACPLSLPSYFYYQLFSGEIVHSTIFEFMVLTVPALSISIAAIWFVRLKMR